MNVRRSSGSGGRGVNRVQCIEILRDAVRDVWEGGFVPRQGFGGTGFSRPESSGEGDLWEFEAGAQLAVGAANDLDADPPVVSRRLAADLIRAGEAVSARVRSLDDLTADELGDDPAWDDVTLEGRGLELVRVDAEEAA